MVAIEKEDRLREMKVIASLFLLSAAYESLLLLLSLLLFFNVGTRSHYPSGAHWVNPRAHTIACKLGHMV